MNFLISAKAMFSRAFNPKLTDESETEIDALNQKLRRQKVQLKEQQKRLDKRKNAAFGEHAIRLAYELTIDELSKQLLLTVEQKDAFATPAWPPLIV